MSSPTSLRDLYAPPPAAWAFNAPPTNATEAVSVVTPPSTSYQWSTRQSGSSLLGMTGKLPDDEGLDVKALIVGLFTSALLQYATTAVAVPWEVSKTLLQVQWIPRDLDTIPTRELEYEDEEEVCIVTIIASPKVTQGVCAITISRTSPPTRKSRTSPIHRLWNGTRPCRARRMRRGMSFASLLETMIFCRNT